MLELFLTFVTLVALVIVACMQYSKEQRRKMGIASSDPDSETLEHLQTLMKLVKNSAENKENRPYNFLICGGQHAGKSSLINTLLRVIKWDRNFNLCRKASAFYSGAKHGTFMVNSYPDVLELCNIVFIDSPGMEAETDLEFMKAVLENVVDGEKKPLNQEEYNKLITERKPRELKDFNNMIDAVILCQRLESEPISWKVTGKFSTLLRQKGIPSGIIVTCAKSYPQIQGKMQQLRNELGGHDLFAEIENYYHRSKSEYNIEFCKDTHLQIIFLLQSLITQCNARRNALFLKRTSS